MNDTRALEIAVELVLSKKDLTDKDLQTITDFYQENARGCPLRRLVISQNKLTKGCVEAMAALLNPEVFPVLEEIDISHNKIKGSSIPKMLLAQIIKGPPLRAFKVAGNDFGPEGVSLLSKAFQASPQLCLIDMGWKSFTKTAGGAVVAVDSGGDKPQGKDHMGPKKFIQLVSKHVMISPDQRVARKMTGGDQFNSNIQWELPELDAEGCYSYTYQLYNNAHWIAVGWAPECIELDRKQYNKYGCYLTSTGFAVGPAGTPSVGLEVTGERGSATVIKATYDPHKHVCTWKNLSAGASQETLGVFNEVSIYPPLFPTVCFGHQGGQISMVGTSRFIPRNRTHSDSTASRLSMASQVSTSERDDSGPSTSSPQGGPRGIGITPLTSGSSASSSIS
ncbi:MAG: hypothetical protein Q8P67_03145 [archaeon]|nr:hypothetical protein [archaeon]